MKEMSLSLKEKLKKLPDEPGVYTHLDEGGNIIYVGKAKNLKHRVKQYFQKNLTDIKTVKLVENICDTNWIVTDSEVEALLLECNLIKQYRPYYNILLKDDKSYPYIKLTVNEAYPRLYLTRKRLLDKARYFGPFAGAYNARKTIEALNRVYPIRMCNKKLEYSKSVGRVCLNYHIGQCCGACRGDVSEEEYSDYVEDVLSVLSGNIKPLTDKLTEEMLAEADKLNFESASYIKELIGCVTGLFSKQKIASDSFDERDIIAVSSDDRLSCVQLFFVREGKIVKSETRYMTKEISDSDSDVLSSFIKQYYPSGAYIPREVLVSDDIDEAEVLSDMLSELRGAKSQLHCPKIGDKKRLVELALKNAEMNITNKRTAREQALQAQNRALNEIAQVLDTGCAVSRIESVDISNISGSDNVGVVVAFVNGRKETNSYRRFRIKYVSGQNDYGSMSEVIFRRLSHAKEELEQNVQNPKFLPLPQVILVDGGLNHVNAVNSVVSDFGFNITVAGLVKDNKHKLRGLIRADGSEMKTESFKYSKKLLNEISEEVHRYAIEYHRLSRSKSMLKTELEGIEGVGAKRCMILLKHFGSMEKLKNAELSELASLDGMSKRAAQSVYDYFNMN